MQSTKVFVYIYLIHVIGVVCVGPEAERKS